MDAILEAHRLITRFLMRATYGDVNDPKSGSGARKRRNRRIGVGHFGVQGFWAKLGVRYSDIPGNSLSAQFLDELYFFCLCVRQTAREYAFRASHP